MAVHAQSVISPWLNSYYSTFYNAITNLENSAYTTDTVLKWQGLFNKLDGQMTTYKLTSRATAFYDFITAFYTYYILNQLYGTDGSQMNSGDARNVFVMNGFMNAVIGRALNYYNDWISSTGSGAVIGTITRVNGVITAITLSSPGTLYLAAGTTIGISGGGGSGAYATVAVDIATGALGPITIVHGGSGYTSNPTVLICIGSSVKLAADSTTVANSVTNENNTMVSLEGTFRGVISPLVTKMLFEDITPLTSFTKQQIANQFFNNFHYKPVYTQLNMAPLTLPPGV